LVLYPWTRNLAGQRFPLMVILIIMSVYFSYCGHAGRMAGLDYMVSLAEKVLRSNPKYIILSCPVLLLMP